MRVKNLSDFVSKFVVSGLISAFMIISANYVYAETAINETSAEQKGIVGVWQLKTSKQSKVSQIGSAPESLILAADEQINEITINENFEKEVHTQTLPTDGTIIKNIRSNGQSFAKAFWKDKKLIVEITNSAGNKMTEIFELSANQKQLNVTLQISDSQSAKPITLRRVYNRTSQQVETENNTAEIGISQYLL